MNREVELLELILKEMVDDSDTVSVKEFETSEEDTRQLEVLVSQKDIARIIGKNGKNISAIRTIVQACSSINDQKKIKINVDSY